MSDLISRQAAIDAIKRAIWDKHTAKDAIDAVCNVPSAQPVDKDINVPTNDIISRQAAVDELHGKDPSQIWDTADVEVWINSLPPAQTETVCIAKVTLSDEQIQEAVEKAKNEVVQLLPTAERKKGRWVLVDGYRCSQCNHKLQTTGIPMRCPNCGADMRGKTDE